MAYYWFAKNIPELQEVAVADRREWWHVARERVWRGRIRWVCLATGVFAYACAIGIAGRLHLNSFAGFLAVMAAAGMVAWSFDAFFLQPRGRQWLREHLHEFRIDDDPPAAKVAS